MARTLRSIIVVITLTAGLAALASPAVSGRDQSSGGTVVFAGGRVLSDNGLQSVPWDVIAQHGMVTQVLVPNPKAPLGGRRVELAGKFVIPGLISAHAHISAVDGLKPAAYTPENTIRQLRLFARYGITTVVSLGGEQPPAFAARDSQNAPTLDRARILVAGEVITGRTPEEARQMVERVAATKPDIIKIRVDDNLGTTTKMTPEVYRAVIDEAHKRNLQVAAHIFYLEDAKGVLRAGADVIAHSVRDMDIDDEFIALMKARNVAYCPTLTREISAFGYESTPAFFSDPFFSREADPAVVARLSEPARQAAMAASPQAQRYKAGLAIAKRNLKKAADRGVLIVMGTDSGASAERFEGFFEHLEMEMMADAGLTPGQVLRAAGLDAATAMGAKHSGVIEKGAFADFVVLDKDPLADIKNLREISAVYVAGNRVAR